MMNMGLDLEYGMGSLMILKLNWSPSVSLILVIEIDKNDSGTTSTYVYNDDEGNW